MRRLAFLKIIFIMILIVSLIYDGKRHFDDELVKTKISKRSGQYHWNLFFPQKIILQNSSLRYHADFEMIEKIIEPKSVVLSDLPTSHYAAVNLPVYIRNTQPHQGRYTASSKIAKLFDKLDFCFMNNPKRKLKVLKALKEDMNRTGSKYYILLNRDAINRNLLFDCLTTTDQYVKEEIKDFTELVYSGEYLDLYDMNFDAVISLTSSSLKNSN